VVLSGNRINYEKISLVLLAPDKNTPEELIDALWLTSQTATPKAMAALMIELKRHCPSFPQAKYTPLDIAVLAYLLSPDLLQTVHAESYMLRRRNYKTYKAHKGLEIPAEVSRDIVYKLQEAMDDNDELRNHGRHSRISIFQRGDQLWLTVRRGKPFKRDSDLEKNQKPVIYRPARYDILIIDRAQKELRINAPSIEDVHAYRHFISQYMFKMDDAFFDAGKYTLEPIIAQGRGCLSTEGVKNLQKVRLVELHRRRVRRKGFKRTNHDEIHRDDDIFDDLEERPLDLEKEVLIEATFKLKFAGSSERAVTITPPNGAGFCRDGDCDAIEQWLALRGFYLPLSETPAPTIMDLLRMSVEQLEERRRDQERKRPFGSG